MTPTGIPRHRFANEIDDYFICKVCQGVAVKPTECSHCESVVCTQCVQDLEVCPHCARDLVRRDIARFGKKVYASFVLTCKNKEGGCKAQGSVDTVLAHEQECQYSLVSCRNSLCGKSFYLKDAYQDQVCSATCYEVHRFKHILPTLPPDQLFLHIASVLHDMHTNIRLQLHSQLHPALLSADQQLSTIHHFWTTERLTIEQEIEDRRCHWHSGKWSTSAKWWTCCHSEDTFAIGCKKLS